MITLSETGVSSVLSPSVSEVSSDVPSGTVVSSEGTEVPSASSAASSATAVVVLMLVLSSCDTLVTAASDELSDCSLSSGTSASPVTEVTVVS